jgi:hypothetical protein
MLEPKLRRDTSQLVDPASPTYRKRRVNDGEADIFLLKADKVFAQQLSGGVCQGMVHLAGVIS